MAPVGKDLLERGRLERSLLEKDLPERGLLERSLTGRGLLEIKAAVKEYLSPLNPPKGTLPWLVAALHPVEKVLAEMK